MQNYSVRQRVKTIIYRLTPICPENVCSFMPAENIKMNFRLDFFMDANNMKPNQTAPKGTV